MTTYEKRDDQKLEGMMNSVKGILESIVFKQEAEHMTWCDGSTHTYYVGQPKGANQEQDKSRTRPAHGYFQGAEVMRLKLPTPSFITFGVWLGYDFGVLQACAYFFLLLASCAFTIDFLSEDGEYAGKGFRLRAKANTCSRVLPFVPRTGLPELG